MHRDFAPEATPRIKVRYRVQSTTHNAVFRVPRGTTESGISGYVSKIGAFFTALAPLMWQDWEFVATFFARQDSNIFLPSPQAVLWTDEVTPGVQVAFARAASDKAVQTRFEGRSAEGSRANITLFGIAFDMRGAAADFRVMNGENATIQAATGALSEVSPALVGIDSEPVFWYPYVNVSYNDHWKTQVRNG